MPARHWFYLIGGSIAFLPIVAEPLYFFVFFFLIVVCRVPIAFQTGPGYVKHPVYDHPIFFWSVFLAFYFSIVSFVYLAVRLATAAESLPVKQPHSDLDD